MPLAENDQKSIIGESALTIIASLAGYSLVPPPKDKGVDFSVHKIAQRGTRTIDMGGVVDIQLKSSSRYSEDDGHIVYDLESKTFNDMVYRNAFGNTPFILVLMTLEDSAASSIDVREREIAIKRSMYWYTTEETTPRENEDSSVRIRIPVAQRLDLSTFGELVRNLDA